MEESGERQEGLFASSKRLAGVLFAVAQNRLELFLVECQEERLRLFEALLLSVAIAALGTMTLGVMTLTVLVIFWEDHRVAALVCVGLLYLLATVAACWRLRHCLRNWPAFAATLAELKKDKAWLEGKNWNDCGSTSRR
jgi:uncharacterized membrane protein YqjE